MLLDPEAPVSHELAEFERTTDHAKGRQFAVPHPNGRHLLSCTLTGVRHWHFLEEPNYFRPTDSEVNYVIGLIGHHADISGLEACPSRLPFRDLIVEGKGGASIHAAVIIIPLGGESGHLATPEDIELRALFETLAKAHPFQ